MNTATKVHIYGMLEMIRKACNSVEAAMSVSDTAAEKMITEKREEFNPDIGDVPVCTQAEEKKINDAMSKIWEEVKTPEPRIADE